MHLADEVLLAVPIRQWVLSFPLPRAPRTRLRRAALFGRAAHPRAHAAPLACRAGRTGVFPPSLAREGVAQRALSTSSASSCFLRSARA